MIGTRLGSYTIVERLGAGGMGVVYRAEDERLGRPVAIKVLPLHLGDDPAARDRFLREARAASRLEQANVCTIHEVGETGDGSLFMCMSYYPGETLQQRLQRGPVPPREAVRIARDVARGLACAHRSGIVHRDIKPANVMLTTEGEVKILDFGLAALAGDERLTRTGTTMGTVPYMSPEQVRGEEVGPRTDIWSLGVVLYQMITGRLPFAGASDAAVFQAILSEDPPPPRAGDTEAAEELARVVMWMLQRDPAERLGSAARAVQLLEALQSGEGSGAATVGAGAAAPPIRRRRGRRRRLALPGIAAVATVAAVAAVAAVLLRGGGSAGYRSVAVMPFASYTGDAADTAVAEGLAYGLISRLGEVRGLEVVGRSEAWRVGERGLGAVETGERLGVGLLVEGGVSREDGELVAAMSLVDTHTGQVVWSGHEDDGGKGVFVLQQRLAARVVGLLSLTLTPRERVRLARNPTTSFKAYEYVLDGRRMLDAVDDAAGVGPAVELFRQAIRMDPDFALAWVGLSEALWIRARREGVSGDLEEAADAARRAVAIDPDLPAARVALARTLRGSGDVEASIAELEEVLADHPHPDEAQIELAHSYQRVGDLKAAERCFRAATIVGAEDWRNWNELGAFLWKKGSYGQASEAFAKAAAVAPPEVTKPSENLAAVEISRGNFDAAIDAYAHITAPIRSAILASNIGTAYYFSDRPDKWEKAEEYYRLAVQLNPGSDEIRRNLGDLYAHRGRQDDARPQYREALAIVERRLAEDPGDGELRLRKAFYAARAGQCDGALELADTLRDELPGTAESAHTLAYVYALCGRHAAALVQVRAAVDAGVPGALLREEDELASLRGDPAFRAAVGLSSASR